MILAENSFTITKSLFLEGMMRTLRESLGKSIRKAILFLVIAWAILAAVTVYLKANVIYIGVEAVVMAIVVLYLWVLLPRGRAKRAYQRFADKCGMRFERVTRFYEDRLVIDAADAQTVIPYDEIRQILHTKRLLVLVKEDRTGVLLARSGFTTGDVDAVTRLINNVREDKQ